MATDFQEAFYILMAPFVYYVALPTLVASGILLSIVMAVLEIIFTPPSRSDGVWDD